MAISDIASLVVKRVLDEANTIPEITASVGDSLAAEPGPPTGVRPFTGADASPGALMAKLGARVFQRARERRVANDKEQKAVLDEQYRRAQIENLTRQAAAQQIPRDRSITTRGGQVISGLTAEEQARHTLDMENDPAPEEMLSVGEDGKPLPFKMKRSDYLTWRGQNKTEQRAAAARSLAERLQGQRTAQAGSAATTLAQTRYLGALPNEGEVYNRAVAEAAAQVDSTAAAGGKKFMRGDKGKKDRQAAIELAVTPIYRRMMSERDSLSRGPLDILRRGATSDSTRAAQPIELPKSFTDLFN